MSPTPINLWRSARLIVCALSLSTCACAALAGERDAFVVGAVPGAILPLEFAAPSTVPGPSGPSGAAGASEAAPAVQGISADYAREVALRLSRPLEWRVYPDRSAMMEALAHSEIDAATAATGNDTDLPVVLSHPYLPTQQIFIEARTKHAPTGRVAYVEAQTSPTRLQSAYPHLHPVSYRSVSSALLAVAIGDADAFVGDLVAASYTMDHFDLTGLRVSGFAPFDEGGYIFAFAAGKPGVTELVEQVNAALARLPARFQLEAHSRWGVTTAAVDANGPLDLTDAERAWIAAHPVVTYAMLDRAAPLGFRDARGNPAGFAVDMLEAIERLTGLHFVPRVDFSIEDIERDLSDGTALLTPVPLPPVEGVRLLSSRPFGEGLFVIVTRTGSTPRRNPDALKGVRVAVPASSLVGAEVQRRVPSVQLVETTGHHAIFDALASGRADAAVSEMGFANYAASNPYRDKLEITGVFSSEPEQYRFSVVEREPVLAGILDRALGRLHGAQLDAIRSRWSLGEHPETLWERRRPLVQFTAAIGAGIVVLLCAWAMSLRTQITRRAAAEAALRAAKEEAETANRAKSTFLATMSHEIRTPMSAVLGLLELELRGPGDRASTERSLATAQQAARELLSLIDDILDVAKIEAERLDLAPAPLELDAWVESVAAIYGQAARGKDIRLTVEKRGSAGPAWVTADALRLRQVVGNLLSNAIKFTSKGGVTLAYRVGEMANGVREVVFDISDTGIGMTREQQSALFAPFVQVHDNRSGHFGGTGLGLSICRRLTTMMGGSVAVESEPGCGSRFTVRLALPAAQPVAGPAAIEADERTKAASELAALAGLHALVIDDHLANRIVVSGQLVELGCTADTASDGAEGLARWVSDPAAFDLMMVDCSMPVMRGEEVARRVRAREASATVPAGPAGSARGPVPIVGMTADAQPEAAARAVEAGMNVCLVKPVAIDDLRRVLAAVLAGAPASLRAHAQSASLIDPQPAHPSEAERVPVGNAQPASQPLPSSKHDGRPAHRPPTFSGKAVARARSQRRPLFDFGTKLHPESRADAPLRSGRSSEDRPAQAAPSPAVSDATFDRALVDAFGAQADGLIDALRTANAEDFDKARAAMTARDYAYLHDTAHRMKGAAVVIGAAPFVAACAALQLACRAAFNPDPGSATHNDDHTATPPDTRVVAAFRAFVDEGAALENALSNHTPSPSVEPFPKQRVF